MTPAMIMALAQVIFMGIQMVQKIWPSGQGKGVVKKEVVTGMADGLIKTWQDVTTGGAHTSAEQYAPLVSGLIEMGVSLLKTDPATGGIVGLTGKDAQ